LAGTGGKSFISSKIVKETTSKPLCHKSSDPLNSSSLIRLVGEDVGRDPKPLGLRKIFLLPKNLPCPVFKS
jgi:hypothetical protein